MRVLHLPSIVAAVALAAPVSARAADPFGVWETEQRDAHVRIAPCDDRLCGVIVWLARPADDSGAPIRDRRNERSELRDRPILGLNILHGFAADAARQWSGGDIYNPDDGATYRAALEPIDTRTLAVKGCLWIVCRTQIWRRVDPTTAD